MSPPTKCTFFLCLRKVPTGLGHWVPNWSWGKKIRVRVRVRVNRRDQICSRIIRALKHSPWSRSQNALSCFHPYWVSGIFLFWLERLHLLGPAHLSSHLITGLSLCFPTGRVLPTGKPRRPPLLTSSLCAPRTQWLHALHWNLRVFL